MPRKLDPGPQTSYWLLLREQLEYHHNSGQSGLPGIEVVCASCRCRLDTPNVRDARLPGYAVVLPCGHISCKFCIITDPPRPPVRRQHCPTCQQLLCCIRCNEPCLVKTIPRSLAAPHGTWWAALIKTIPEGGVLAVCYGCQALDQWLSDVLSGDVLVGRGEPHQSYARLLATLWPTIAAEKMITAQVLGCVMSLAASNAEHLHRVFYGELGDSEPELFWLSMVLLTLQRYGMLPSWSMENFMLLVRQMHRRVWRDFVNTLDSDVATMMNDLRQRDDWTADTRKQVLP